MKRVKSPDKQAKAGRIKSVTLLTKPPTAPLELLSAPLHRIFYWEGLYAFIYSWCLINEDRM